MTEIERVKRLLRDRGPLHYIVRPRYIWTYGRYVLRTIRERWPERRCSIYVLEMPVLPMSAMPGIRVHYIDCVEPLLEFAHEREEEDEEWHGNSYIAELEQRFARGDRCFAAEQAGRIASILFTTSGPCPISEVSYVLSIPRHTLGLYDVYTLSRYRGKHLYYAVFRNCINACAVEGYRAVWMWILPENLVSLHVHDQLGLRHIILEVSTQQGWGIRRHEVRSLDMNIADLLEKRSPEIGSEGDHNR